MYITSIMIVNVILPILSECAIGLGETDSMTIKIVEINTRDVDCRSRCSSFSGREKEMPRFKDDGLL